MPQRFSPSPNRIIRNRVSCKLASRSSSIAIPYFLRKFIVAEKHTIS